MRFPTPEQVLFIHSRLVDETGGSHGVRDLPMLLSALGRPQASFNDQDLYPDLWSKAAALMDSLIRNHPFVDGNKRTAVTAASLFLRINGYHFQVKIEEMVQFTLECAQAQHSIDEITSWFKPHSSKSNI